MTYIFVQHIFSHIGICNLKSGRSRVKLLEKLQKVNCFKVEFFVQSIKAFINLLLLCHLYLNMVGCILNSLEVDQAPNKFSLLVKQELPLPSYLKPPSLFTSSYAQMTKSR